MRAVELVLRIPRSSLFGVVIQIARQGPALDTQERNRTGKVWELDSPSDGVGRNLMGDEERTPLDG